MPTAPVQTPRPVCIFRMGNLGEVVVTMTLNPIDVFIFIMGSSWSLMLWIIIEGNVAPYRHFKSGVTPPNQVVENQIQEWSKEITSMKADDKWLKLSVHSSSSVALLPLVRLSISWCHVLGRLTCSVHSGGWTLSLNNPQLLAFRESPQCMIIWHLAFAHASNVRGTRVWCVWVFWILIMKKEGATQICHFAPGANSVIISLDRF